MNINKLKQSFVLLIILFLFMGLFVAMFGSKNIVIFIGILIIAIFMIRTDLTYKPLLSFIKIWLLLTIMAIISYISTPVSIIGIILTAMLVFGITFSSFHMLTENVYLAYLMSYLFMLYVPVNGEEFSLRLLALFVGSIFIILFNFIVNRKKQYKVSEETILSLLDEVESLVCKKLNGGDVSEINFKINKTFYLALFDNLENKLFSTPFQDSILTVSKSIQHIGYILKNNSFSKNELELIKDIIHTIKDYKDEASYNYLDKFNFETTNGFSLILINFRIIYVELEKMDLMDFKDKLRFLKDRDVLKKVHKSNFKSIFSFKSVKFTFALKMTLLIVIWEFLDLLGVPFVKWLSFTSIAMLIPYADDIKDMSKLRIKATGIGVLLFCLIMVFLFSNFSIFALCGVVISKDILIMILMVIITYLLLYYMENPLYRTMLGSILSIIASLKYLPMDVLVLLKILWVIVSIFVTNFVNLFLFKYDTEKETKEYIKSYAKINSKFMGIIRKYCDDSYNSSEKTTLMITADILSDNIELNFDRYENDDLFEYYSSQKHKLNISNFILDYMVNNDFSKKEKFLFKEILDNEDFDVDNINVNNDDRIVLVTLNYLRENQNNS